MQHLLLFILLFEKTKRTINNLLWYTFVCSHAYLQRPSLGAKELCYTFSYSLFFAVLFRQVESVSA